MDALEVKTMGFIEKAVVRDPLEANIYTVSILSYLTPANDATPSTVGVGSALKIPLTSGSKSVPDFDA